MSQGIRELQNNDLLAALEALLAPRLAGILSRRAPGHCMRITDLDQALMVRLCRHLRRQVPTAEVVVLATPASELPADLMVSSTKLVELRNPREDGSLRPPLLVFVPERLQAAAEDSFGVATFEVLELGDVYGELRKHLLQRYPQPTRNALELILRRVDGQDGPVWPFADGVSVVRFLLTGLINEADDEAIGAALFELGLVPDFELLKKPEAAPARIARNRDVMQKLTWSDRSERGRVLTLELTDTGFQQRLANFLVQTGLESPRAWTRRIVMDRNHWHLAFHQWPFEDGGQQPGAICIHGVTTHIPPVREDSEDPRLVSLIGQQVFNPTSLKSFAVSFQCEPTPNQVEGLERFVLEVISQQDGPTGLIRRRKATSKASARVSFDRLGKVEWDEGWYFVRVIAHTRDNEPIPLVDFNGDAVVPTLDPQPGKPLPPNQSDLFYVLVDEDIEVEIPQRAVPNEISLTHARRRLQFQALTEQQDPDRIPSGEVAWSQGGGNTATNQALEVKFGAAGTVKIPVSRNLCELEQRILDDARGPLSFRLTVKLGAPEHIREDVVDWPALGEPLSRFQQAREDYFRAIAGDKRLITQGVDLSRLQSPVAAYAEAYQVLLQELLHRAEGERDDATQAIADIRRLLALDSVTVNLVDHRQNRREAVLLGPTHPLRALWLVTWAKLGERWLAAAGEAARDHLTGTRRALLQELSPGRFPPVLYSGSGKLLTAVDNVHPFWALYAAASDTDPRGLVGEVCRAFGLAEPGIGGSLIDGDYLASRVQRYLVQHPYVTTLVVNVFNPGHGKVLADMLLALQRQPAFQNIRYDIRLLVNDPEAPGVGAALMALFAPMSGTTVPEAEPFGTPTETHLRPKLAVALRAQTAFRDRPQLFQAHLTFLFDVFPAEEVGVVNQLSVSIPAPLYGLVQDNQVSYQEGEAVVAWHHLPRHGKAAELPDAEELTDLLSTIPATLSHATATVATGQTGRHLLPEVTLALHPEQRALLHQIHEVSDWVLTLDRHLGIEYFDHGGKQDRPDYLIDHSPEAGLGGQHRLVITSRSVAELENLLRPVLEDFSLQVNRQQVVTLLDQLRSLSGRLALKLISDPNQRQEALGLALARLYLDYQGVFHNQIVVPLDAHIDLYRDLRNKEERNEQLSDSVSFKRTDLALFDLNAERGQMVCRLVEVKAYRLNNLDKLVSFKNDIAEQITRSEKVLAQHFDPHHSRPDRPDRLLKNQELRNLLSFYLARAERYGLMNPAVAEEARYFLAHLDQGYRLNFTRSALVFDLSRRETAPVDVEEGIEFHYIGLDLIQSLLDAVVMETVEPPALAAVAADEEAAEPVASDSSADWRGRAATSVPSLTTAAFLAPRRERRLPVPAEQWPMPSGVIADTQGHYSKPSSAPSDEEPALKPVAETPAADADQHTDLSVQFVDLANSKAADDLPCPAATADKSGELPPDSPQPESAASSKSEVKADQAPEPATADNAAVTAPAPAEVDEASPDIMLGVSGDSPQYGVLGEISGRTVAVDLNQTHTISLFGVQGGGKSYTLGTIVEMATLPIPRINRLPNPLATVIFHYSPTINYRPEFTSMVASNDDEGQLRILQERYGAMPRALADVLLLVPADKLNERRAEYPGIRVEPLRFSAAELQAGHWLFLMGAVGNQANYIRQIRRLMKRMRNNLTLEALRTGVADSDLSEHLKTLANSRLDLAADYIDDSADAVGHFIRPGRLVIVDLRDEYIEKDEALGLFVVLLQLFADARLEGQPFNKLVVFDEAHKYIESPDLVKGLIEVVREMRHKGTSILVASQDPPSVPTDLIELSSQIILHKFNSPAWLKHIQKANTALANLTPDKMAKLRPGEAYVWSSKASDEMFSREALKLRCRPRVTKHGGETKTAV